MLSAEVLFRTIRTETDTLHQKLEGETALAELMRDELSEPRYHAILQVFHRRLSILEKTIFPDFRLKFTDFELNSRLHDLERDLGISAQAVSPRTKSSGLSAMQLLGIVYVWEGSKLGGQLISRSLQNRFGTGFHTRFFNSEPAELGSGWKKFRALLAREIDTPRKLAAFLRSANQEFEYLYEEFLFLEK